MKIECTKEEWEIFEKVIDKSKTFTRFNDDCFFVYVWGAHKEEALLLSLEGSFLK
jgi:hypothetical protein